MNTSSKELILKILTDDVCLSNEARVVLSLLIDEPAFCRALAAPNLTLKDTAAALCVCNTELNTTLKQLPWTNKLLLLEIVLGCWRISPLLIMYFKTAVALPISLSPRGRNGGRKSSHAEVAEAA